MSARRSLKPAVYLAGRMNRNNPADVQWRKELTPFLEELGFDILDPCDLEPAQLQGLRPNRLPEGVKHWHELRNSTDPAQVARFVKYMRRIIKFDLNIVKNITDIVIVLWDEGCRSGAGTHSEITVAFDVGKLVYCVATAELPAWAFGCCQEIFKSFDELKTFMKKEYGGDDDQEGTGTTQKNS